ncbi:TPA: stability/ partitioning determinant [Citrobacter freundii]|uniref:Stability/ partitioning determinant n=1 Tax=Citrobacter freundii TaxID=546 RepID=A0ABY7L8L6_CITFR|nr:MULTISPECIES: stability/ partitioning determinant [Citrobacter freundii complex]EIJ9084853.1 stability/ partitioning determinant [Citrobacter freundii]EJH9549644.1 stability/ partitioning determinant [Citrobacter freundii]EJO6485778.1 stability/ partitioning determinant [Citrobacter freundii]EKW5688229.1 stability/ partitioning determinant [Citrobacter freundii]EKX9690365.1 stability/ partitioning determinant [Citrobacter freundii]
MKLKPPSVDLKSTETPSNYEVSRFINEGDKRPSKAKTVQRTYRLNPAFIDIMEAEALRTGLGNTDILKAALCAYSKMPENERNHWLLEFPKM